jgi:hypothetical protein
MHSQSTVAYVLALRAQRLGARRIAAKADLPLGTVRDWLAGKLPTHSRPFDPKADIPPACAVCGHHEHDFGELPAEYVYLLGLYLGEGCISAHRRGVFRLRIFLDLKYPQIVEDCCTAMRVAVPRSKVNVSSAQVRLRRARRHRTWRSPHSQNPGHASFRSMDQARNTIGASC